MNLSAGQPMPCPSWKRWFRRLVTLSPLLLVLAILASWILAPVIAYYTARPVIRVDYYKQLVEPLTQVPESDRAWPIYVQAVAAMGPVNNRDHWLRAQPAAPGSQDWTALTADLALHADAIGLIRRAAGMDFAGFIPTDADDPLLAATYAKLYGYTAATAAPSPSPDLSALLLPQLGTFRQFGRTLGYDMIFAAENGRPEDSLSDLQAMLRVAQHAREMPMSICDLVSIAITDGACQSTVLSLQRGGDSFSADHLARLQSIIESQLASSRVVRFFYDRAALADWIQRIYSETSPPELPEDQPPGRLTIEGAKYIEARFASWGLSPTGNALEHPGLVMALRDPGRRAIARTGERFISAQEDEQFVPLHQRLPRRRVEIAQNLPAPYASRVRQHPILGFGLGFPEWQWGQPQITEQRRDATIVIIAMHRFRAVTGRFPDRLSDLVPEFLRAEPLDHFTNLPLRYALRDGHPVLYSVGMDRDDDGGRQASPAFPPDYRPPSSGQLPEPIFNPMYEADGDWVFWPPQG